MRPLYLRPSYLAAVAMVLSGGTAAAMALAPVAAAAPPVLALTSGASPCGTNGTLTGTTTPICTYTTTGSDAFTVPAGVTQADVTVVGAQGGHYFIAGDAAHGGSPTGDITGRPGGNGGEATGTLTNLTTGQVLQVDVAGIGANGTPRADPGG